MAKINVGEMNLNLIKRFMKNGFPGKKYTVNEYKNFYTAVIKSDDTVMEPILFSKQGAMPLMETLGSKSPEECKNPKVIYEG